VGWVRKGGKEKGKEKECREWAPPPLLFTAKTGIWRRF